MPSASSILEKAIKEKYTFKPFSKEYKKVFARQEHIIKKSLKKINGAVVSHVGSTAIHGMGGKGIVDILVFVPKKSISKAKKALESAGFSYSGNWRKRRLFFSKYYVQKKRARLSHVHLTSETKELHKLITLVGYLKTHKKARKAYEALKRKASKLYWMDGEKYRKFKKKFLSALAKKALAKFK
jgi:GrpB-like predicted nucleotidyltransferase (UPF0157 family)